MREILGYAGHGATTHGEREPIFDGRIATEINATGWLLKEYTLSELTLAEKREQLDRLLDNRSHWGEHVVDKILTALCQ